MSGLSLAQRIAAHGGVLAEHADLLEVVALAHKVTADAVLGRGRRREVTAARRAFMIALRDRGMTLHAIAELTGRNHTTVLDYVSPARREKARTYTNRRRAQAPSVRAVVAAMRVI